MGKALFVTAAANMIWQFNRQNILILKQMGEDVVVATNFEKPGTITQKQVEQLQAWLDDHDVRWYQVDFERGIGNWSTNLKVIRQLRQIMRQEQITLLHCQSPIGAALGRIAAAFERVKVIYTAHGFHFFHGGPSFNWFLFFPIEFYLSFYTDILVVINDEDYAVARHFHQNTLMQIAGIGVDVSGALAVPESQRQNARRHLRADWGMTDDDFVMLNVGELSVRKNQTVILQAMAECDNMNQHLFIAGVGPLKATLEAQAIELGIAARVHFLGYRDDIRNLHYAADVNVFPSKQEGLAIAGLESVIDGLYLIGSDVRGIRDYILTSEMGATFKLNDVKRLSELLEDAQSRRPRVPNSAVKALRQFDREYVNDTMRDLYRDAMQSVEVVQ